MAGFNFGGIPQSAYFGNAGNGGNPAPFSAAWYQAQGLSTNGTPLPPGGGGTASKTPAQVIQDIITNGTAAVPDSLKALGSFSTNTSTASSGLAAPQQGAADAITQKISDLVGTGIPDYTGQRVAQLSDPETAALKNLGTMAAGSGAGTSAVQGATDQKTDTSKLFSAAGPVQTQKLTDVDISKYMNPALSAEYDAILHGNDVMNNATRARMAKSGAFGENMQVAQAQNDESTKRQLALAGSDAFKTAQGAAEGDVSAENAGRQANRNAAMGAAGTDVSTQLTDAQRALTGGQALAGMGQTSTTALDAAGAKARGVQQSDLDAKWQEYLTKAGFNLALPGQAAGALATLPGGRNFTQTSLGPSPAGSEIGALIGLTGLQNQYQYPQGGGGVRSTISGSVPGASSI